MICPSCQAENDDSAEACFTCGRALGALTQGSLIADRYVIESVLGKGGMGMVYKAHDHKLEETVAIKVLRSEFANTQDMARRFRQEIKLARKVTHRNVCRIHDYGEDGGLRYISMEFVDGKDLRQLAREQGGFLPPDKAFEVAIQAADGLQAIHEVGIIHRDLKTTNIMRDTRGLVRLMDFGIAKEGADRSGGGLTLQGHIMGTPEYMSPEQCLGDRSKIDHRSDIYALGIVVYEIFTGQVPFRGDTPVATLFKHLQDRVSFEGPVAGRIPLPAVGVLHKALEKQAADRHASAAELAEDLRQALKQTLAGTSEDLLPTGVMRPVVLSPAAVTPTPVDRRRATRLDIPLNFTMRRVEPGGTLVEHTFAENMGRGGARVMTFKMQSLAPGDTVHLEEMGGNFRTRAEVRGSYVGKDGIRRLNLSFLDSQAPDRLVHVDDPTPGGRTPPPTRRR